MSGRLALPLVLLHSIRCQLPLQAALVLFLLLAVRCVLQPLMLAFAWTALHRWRQELEASRQQYGTAASGSPWQACCYMLSGYRVQTIFRSASCRL